MRLMTRSNVDQCVEGITCNVYFPDPPTEDGWSVSSEVENDSEALRFLSIECYESYLDDQQEELKQEDEHLQVPRSTKSLNTRSKKKRSS